MEATLQSLIDRLNDLSEQFKELREGIGMAIDGATRDPEMALIRSRKVLEYVVRDVFERRVGEPPGTRPLENLIQRLVKDGYLPPRLEAYTETIRKLGNVGAHQFGQKIRAADVYQSLTQLMPILEWYFEVERPEAGVRLDVPHEPHPTRVESESKDGNRASKKHIAVVPKGLRSFDANDSPFFLQLLPGPRDQDGLPESIRFWKHRIEDSNDPSFTVGVIYGPSGCGKSSLVKAGLLPRLSKNITTIYVEATPDETETRLLNGLRRKLATLQADLDLRQTIGAIRQGQGLGADQKVVMVVDQFEQWLNANRHEQDTELAQALRQCDGDHVQCVLMVRDDFWVSLTRFLGELSIDLVQNQNATLVDLFDLIHARKVLNEFGKAYGRLPDDYGSLSKDQEMFLNQAINGLAQDGRVISIRLALFAEMVKGKPWSPTTLKQAGGTEGVGVAFLEETFASTALRSHQRAAQAILKKLLPDSGTDIKGNMRSQEELREASGYAERSREFDDLLRILDSDLRLITPTDPEDSVGGEQTATPKDVRFFQLTHDYLVHSLRNWLTRKQRETRRGRAELRLAERSSLWNAKPENRHLPSAVEWANIRVLTKKKDWTNPQRKVMKRAGLVHGLRTLGLAILVSLITWGAIEGYGRFQGSALVESLQKVDTPNVPAIVKQLSGYRRWADPQLVHLVQSDDDREHLHGSLALLPVDPSQVDYLFNRLIKATPSELPVMRDALSPHRATLTPKLWTVLESAQPGDDALLPAASALASYDRDNAKWQAEADKVAQTLVTINSIYLGQWLEALRPVRGKLTAPMVSIFRDKHPESEHTQATNILSDYASDDPDSLAELLMVAEPKAYLSLFRISQTQAEKVIPFFKSEIAKKSMVPESDMESELVKDRLAERQARAAVALVRLGKADEIWQLLRYSADPRLRSFIVNWLNPLGADPKLIAAELDRIDSKSKAAPAQRQQKMDAILFHPETSMRRALILALGTFGVEGLSPGEGEPLTGKLLDLYRNDPDSGIHGAVEWTLRRWGQPEKLKELDAELSKLKERGDRRWFMNSQGQTYAVIDGPVEFRMGSPPTEPHRNETMETARRMLIPRRFAIAAKEVTIEQWQRFERTHTQLRVPPSFVKQHSPDPDGPMNGFTWYIAANYCNWLSEQEGLPKDQWCYLPAEGNAYEEGMTIPADVLERRGYRLPTEPEWEYACRSGTVTCRYYGQSTELLDAYARYQANSDQHAWSCGSLLPNDLGLFDTLGNEYEWVQDSSRRTMPKGMGLYSDIINISESIIEKNPRMLRGGSFVYQPAGVRSACRSGVAPSYRDYGFGFRPSRTYH